MTLRRKSSLDRHRATRSREGFARVEVSVRKEDVGLVRGVAAALMDPARQEGARLLLRQSFNAAAAAGFKDYLANAPLEGIEVTRAPDIGRDIEL